MDIINNHFWEWVGLIGLILAALYTMRVIGQEQSTFKEESYEVRFGDLALMIPNWWSITVQSENQIRFERTDTRYEWFSLFTYVPSTSLKELTEILKEKLDKEEIEFDIDVVFETDSRVLFRNKEVAEQFQEVIRVEGRAAQSVTERIYYDIYIVRRLNNQGHFIFESRSSVLNGFVEGPYFEEGLAELKLHP